MSGRPSILGLTSGKDKKKKKESGDSYKGNTRNAGSDQGGGRSKRSSSYSGPGGKVATRGKRKVVTRPPSRPPRRP